MLSAVAVAGVVPVVQGEVQGLSQAHSAILFAELVDQGKIVERAPVVNGEFEFRQIPAGTYELRITNAYSDTLVMDFVHLQGQAAARLRIRLPQIKAERPVSGVVSLAQLRHRPPKKAADSFIRAGRSIERKDYREAVTHLRKALALDPAYLEARNNLGTCLMRLGQDQEAEASFRAALELDPSSAFIQANLAAALFARDRFAETETAARRALELDPHAPKNHYILALALRALRRPPQEAITHFRRAAPEIPKAHLAAAQLLASQGAFDQAREEASHYLATAPQDRQAVERWMSGMSFAARP